MPFRLETFTCRPFSENTYLLADTNAGEAIVVDAGGRAEDIVREAERLGVKVVALVNTHSHIDHVAGVEALQKLTGAPFWIHSEAVPMLLGLPQQAARFNLPPVAVPRVDRELIAGEEIQIGAMRLGIRYTPGHAPGHVTLAYQGPPVPLEQGGEPQVFAFCGDVIFFGSIGRTDLPSGDHGVLMRSIENEILSLAPETVLYSGHGPATTVDHERRANPFVLEWMRRPI